MIPELERQTHVFEDTRKKLEFLQLFAQIVLSKDNASDVG